MATCGLVLTTDLINSTVKPLLLFQRFRKLNKYVQKLIKDREGNIWILVWSEIYKYDGEIFYRFSNEQGLLFQNHYRHG
jgi:hypothetical protein